MARVACQLGDRAAAGDRRSRGSSAIARGCYSAAKDESNQGAQPGTDESFSSTSCSASLRHLDAPGQSARFS